MGMLLVRLGYGLLFSVGLLMVLLSINPGAVVRVAWRLGYTVTRTDQGARVARCLWRVGLALSGLGLAGFLLSL